MRPTRVDRKQTLLTTLDKHALMAVRLTEAAAKMKTLGHMLRAVTETDDGHVTITAKARDYLSATLEHAAELLDQLAIDWQREQEAKGR